ncbi:hypothetical protein WJX73_004115 [Symbiochloris irregularis]|uniref:BACK domain-containing protein n=1 Tax=Symbiochloris irregularis TaxID=706552 RepID=A0AAW1NW33_9CHLO
MLRINSDNVLVVPPFEAAWLTDERFQLHHGNGCVEFEVRGQNDASIIFKSSPGGRRWQHAESLVEAQQGNFGRQYTMIVGSHRNTCFKIERNGQQVLQVKDEPCTTLTARQFQRYWIELKEGVITAGYGLPGTNVWCKWQDPNALAGLKFVGLGAWDSYISFRSIAVHPCIQQDGKMGKAPIKLRHAVDPVPTLAQLLTYLAQHLARVVQCDASSFVALSAAVVEQLLLCPALVCKEKVIFDAVILWYEDDQRGKAESMPDILPLIRFPLMSQFELQQVRAHPIAACLALVKELIEEASAFNKCSTTADASTQEPAAQAGLSLDGKRGLHEASALEGQEQQPAVLRRQRRRDLGQAHELTYLFDGDHEGVCHHLGADCGARQWVNPVLTKRLQVRASSPLCRHTDAKAMVDSKLVRSNAAGPQHSPGKGGTAGGSWWSLDLGPAHRLACNYYTLRHDASVAYLRSWVLQGSEDAEKPHWVDLRRHENDLSITRCGQYASWPVLGHAATLPCRLFRILLTGPNANPIPRQDTVCLSSFEFYGYLHDVDPATRGSCEQTQPNK